MRRSILWLSGAVAVVVLAGVAAAGLAPRDPQCVRHGADGVRQLDIGKAPDRAHLEHDLQEVHTVAERFSAAVARRPRTADSIDAVEGYREAPARSRIWCEAILEADVARTHGLSEADLKRFEALDH